MSHGADSTKAIFFALAANGAIAVSKYGAAFVTGSGSMMAEAVHSTADCGNQLLLLLGMKRAKQPPSDDYPLGYGKETYFWSFVVALMLFSIGGLFSVYEGWHKLHEPEPMSYPMLALGVLAFGIVVEALSMAGCMRDALGSMAIGVLLIIVAYFIGIQIKSLLIGQGVSPSIRNDMVQFLNSHAAVKNLLNIRTLQMGPDVMVAIKAVMVEAHDAAKLINDINQVEVDFRKQFEQVAWCFFEPDSPD